MWHAQEWQKTKNPRWHIRSDLCLQGRKGKWISKRENARLWSAFIGLGTDSSAGYCKHGNELLVSQIWGNSPTSCANTVFSRWTLYHGQDNYSCFIIITQISDNGWYLHVVFNSGITAKGNLSETTRVPLYNLMFFWPCIMNWLYINHQLLCTDYYLFIKY